jgi:hypothetical protein
MKTSKPLSEKAQYKSVPIDELIPYARNARTHSDAQVAQIAASIKEFGFISPIIIDADNGIIAGHGRLAAAQKLKLATVPCLKVEHLSETQKRAYILADNKLALNAGWDDEMLRVEIAELQEENFDVLLTGFGEDEMKALLAGVHSAGNGDGSGSSDDNEYTKKRKSPIYTPKGPKPDITELFDTSKCDELVSQINSSDLPEEEKKFLRLAAHRHVVFNYENVAEYYSHSKADAQNLMENSALVIIDFQKAIELGFVKLTEELAEAYANDNTDEE